MITMVATEVLKEAYTFPAETTRLGHLGFLLAWLRRRAGWSTDARGGGRPSDDSIATNIDPAVEREELAPYVEMFNEAARREGHAEHRSGPPSAFAKTPQ